MNSFPVRPIVISLVGALYLALLGPALAQTIRSDLARSTDRILEGIPIDGVLRPAPWIMSLRQDNRHICGASFISPIVREGSVAGWSAEARTPRWAVTAAHCVVDKDTGQPENADEFSLWGGVLNIGGADASGGEVQRVAKIFIPNNPTSDIGAYNPRTLENDIALLLLHDSQNGLGASRISIRLPTTRDLEWMLQPYTALHTAGWGRTSAGGYASADLLEVRIPLVDRETCQAAFAPWNDEIFSGMLCAGYASGEYDSCQGDSGGPLYYRPSQLSTRTSEPVLAGVVSWGRGCGSAYLFGVYTSIAAYLGWIEEIVAEN